MIFVFFKPMTLSKSIEKEIPMFELKKFTLHELSLSGLETLMYGVKGVKFQDRYEIEAIDYTNNSKKYISNIKADFGIYKGLEVQLQKNVVYTREDGFTFKTEIMKYNTQTKIFTSPLAFSSAFTQGSTQGIDMKYDNKNYTMQARDIYMTYSLAEENL